MNNNLIKALETSIKLQESGIHFFSKSARRFNRFQDLKLFFETFAKSKVANKHFLNELLGLARNHSLNINASHTFDFDPAPFDKVIDDTLVVGDNSLPEDILKTAFMYLKESIRLINLLKDSLNGYQDEFSRIISESKLIADPVKKHIHMFTEEVKFYGYE